MVAPTATAWDDLRATLAGMGDAFGNDAADELEAEGDADAARALRGAIKGEPRGAGRTAAEAAWARLQTGVGWTISAWRECYVLGQLREATETGERAAALPAGSSAAQTTTTKTIVADSAGEGDGGDSAEKEKVETDTEGGREALLRRAMLAIDMAHIMGGPGEVVQQFGRAVEALVREGQNKNPSSSAAAVEEEEMKGTPLKTAGGTPLLIPDVLPAAVAVTVDPAHALERAEGLTNREFKRGYFNADKPVALGNLGGAWPAVSKWRDLAWFRDRHGHRNVPLEVGAYDDTSNWREEVMLFSRFIDEYLLPGLADELDPPTPTMTAGEEVETGGGGGESKSESKSGGAVGGKSTSKGVAYLAQHQLFEQLPSLLRDFDPPPVCDVAGGLQRVNAWVGTAGTVTPCHFDSYDNLLGQAAGFKFVRLYAESDTPFLYRHTGAWAENRSWPGEKPTSGGEGGDGGGGGGGGGDGGGGCGGGGGGGGGEGGGGGGGETRGAGEGNGAAAADGDGGGVEMGRPRRDAQGNISQVDVEHPDLEKFPLFAKARHMDVILGPGEFIYIPARTWHYVRGLTTSISLNFLF